jgi:hypothetical protein
MRTTPMVLRALAALALTVGPAAAQGPLGPSAPGSVQGHCARMFDPTTLTSIRGRIVEIEQRPRGASAGIHMRVATETGTTDVHLGPAWYLDAQDAHLSVGDQVEVRGSRITVDNRSAIVAVEVTRGNDVLTLRDNSGVPRWAGWRHGPMRGSTRGPMRG